MPLSEFDRELLQRCLDRKPRAWEDFVDRFLGLVFHVITHTSQVRSIRLNPQDHEDLAADVFLTIISDDMAILRRFRGESSLATYLTVVARRIVVREMLRRRTTEASLGQMDSAYADQSVGHEQRISDREQVQQLLDGLQGPEAEVVRMYHLEGKSYQEISSAVGMPENSIGPTLSRARAKMRRASAS